MPVCGGGEQLHSVHDDVAGPQSRGLGRVVGQQAHRTHAELAQDGCRRPVFPLVGAQPEAMVGLDRVGPCVLFEVRPELVDQPDPAPLVTAEVDEHAAALDRDRAQGGAQLDPAVTAKRAQGISGQAFRVDAGQDAAPVAEVAPDQRQVHDASLDLERVRLEGPKRGGQWYRDDTTRHHGISCPPRVTRPVRCSSALPAAWSW